MTFCKPKLYFDWIRGRSKMAHMKNTTRSNIYLPIVAMILTAALAVPAAAEKQVPFKGAMQGDDTDIGFTNATVTVLTVGKGIGTLLGQFSFTQTVIVEFAT